MAARIAVGLVLLAAGAGKLRQPAWPATAHNFGIGRRLAAVVPSVELAVGALLAAGVGLPWTAVAAAGLVAVFTLLVATRLLAGHAVPCGCFGEVSPQPIGVDTLVRNLILFGGAMAAVVSGWNGSTSGGVISVAVGVVGACLFLAAARARPGVHQ